MLEGERLKSTVFSDLDFGREMQNKNKNGILGQKLGYDTVDWKPERVVQAKIRDQSVTLCLIGSPCDHTSVSTFKFERHQSI